MTGPPLMKLSTIKLPVWDSWSPAAIISMEAYV